MSDSEPSSVQPAGPATAPSAGTAPGRPHRIVPLWVKWFLGMLLAMPIVLVGEALFGVDQAHLLFWWLAFLLLVLFPGRDPEMPRLFFVVSALWVITALVVLTVLLQLILAIEILPGQFGIEPEPLPLVLLGLYGLLFPALLVTLWRRMRVFRLLLVLTTLCNIVLQVVVQEGEPPRGIAQESIALALGIGLDVAVAAYLLLHFHPRRKTAPAGPSGGDLAVSAAADAPWPGS